MLREPHNHRQSYIL